ncbi:tellurite resistance TerB family protein [Oricola sp.]|uniref:tellurite resistance TerB family protein n=1 Tax=Oricola sp. TaxID=1979950 RepID=UPI0025F0C2AF|nr:tellurite resistance TerB family protein [Oricola sp.]MCI5078166.1 tellurite resistance TerB family protein [Oricola sp.]
MRTLTPQEALAFVMVTTAAADAALAERELERIGHVVDTLPVFKDFTRDQLVDAANRCTALLNEPAGIDHILAMVKENLPERFYDTAYAVGTEVAAADLRIEQEELRFLQMLRDELEIDALVSAAIERSARARFRLA